MKAILPLFILVFGLFSCEKIDEFQCGNGILEEGEECDGTQFGLVTCASYGHESGHLRCTEECTIDTSQCCQFRCPEGAGFCEGEQLFTCSLSSSSGCFEWVETDCAAISGGSCMEATAGAQCFYGCQNQCDLEGETRCKESNLERCESDELGCLDWTQLMDCAAQGQACHGEPLARCVNIHGPCAVPGERRCNSDWIELCETLDGSPLWIVAEDCAQGGSYCVEADVAWCASVSVGDSCANPLSIAVPFTRDGTAFNQDFSNSINFSGTSGCAYQGATTAEAVFHLSLTQDATVVITEGGAMDASIKILDGCTPHDLVCLAEGDEEDTLIQHLAQGDYFIVVEPRTESEGDGAYQISITTE